MNFIFPILAAILQANSLTLDKTILSIKRVNFKNYTGVSFPLIFFITLVIFLIFRPPLSLNLLTGNLWWLLFVSIGINIVTNLVFYRALGDDKLSEIQTLDLLHIIPIIIFSSIIFTDERNFAVIIPALVASVAIIWSHLENRHFKIAKRTLPFLLWSLSAASVGAIISKILLASWNPISLELVRSGVMALILGSLFSKQIKKIPSKAFWFLLATNISSSVAWILYYFSYQRSGIIYTVLIFSLQPLLVYFASVFFLKERLRWKKTVAFFVVLLSIAAAQIISG
jgi:drug/metabolite transporter (DMT)-like permease